MDMTRLELLTVLLSIKALLESDNKDKALELINEVISEAKRQNKTWEQCTSDESKDSSQFDLCCPYYQSIGWYNQYDYIKLSNSPRIELENYLSDGGYDTYDNFSQCLKDILKMPSVQYIWERLAFVNYVQIGRAHV